MTIWRLLIANPATRDSVQYRALTVQQSTAYDMLNIARHIYQFGEPELASAVLILHRECLQNQQRKQKQSSETITPEEGVPFPVAELGLTPEREEEMRRDQHASGMGKDYPARGLTSLEDYGSVMAFIKAATDEIVEELEELAEQEEGWGKLNKEEVLKHCLFDDYILKISRTT
ncbi:hypothetical protein QBC46DRAFT_357308 [Diplogelasinospora grovesii]|uniref:Uncharacterized protein n=1 Tax=Diplogelasinospora grovesii TaxID=303347 RepID=A0AAN6MZW7_9PEZI|nr:hypothetical protein QBC46DRAFT_357308 [Diplogelasinospora grovesii]